MMSQPREANGTMIGANTDNSAWRKLVLPDLSAFEQIISDEGTPP